MTEFFAYVLLVLIAVPLMILAGLVFLLVVSAIMVPFVWAYRGIKALAR